MMGYVPQDDIIHNQAEAVKQAIERHLEESGIDWRQEGNQKTSKK